MESLKRVDTLSLHVASVEITLGYIAAVSVESSYSLILGSRYLIYLMMLAISRLDSNPRLDNTISDMSESV